MKKVWTTTDVNRAAELAIGGWELTGITTLQTGFPFGVGSSDIGGVQGTVAPRPNFVQGCNPHAGLTGRFQRLNMACFSQQLPGTFGNTTRNFLRQPGINNWDMGFAKNFHFTERVNFKLNVDTFNTFNHHQYAGDVGGLVVGGSGGNEVVDSGVRLERRLLSAKLPGRRRLVSCNRRQAQLLTDQPESSHQTPPRPSAWRSFLLQAIHSYRSCVHSPARSSLIS